MKSKWLFLSVAVVCVALIVFFGIQTLNKWNDAQQLAEKDVESKRDVNREKDGEQKSDEPVASSKETTAEQESDSKTDSKSDSKTDSTSDSAEDVAGSSDPSTGTTGSTGATTSNPNAATASVITDIESQLGALRVECQGQLQSLYQSYQATSDKQKRKQYVSAGFSALGQCDSRFNGIMNELYDRLAELGEADSAENRIASYRATYETIKDSELLNLDPSG